jgi:hypothetical protein
VRSVMPKDNGEKTREEIEDELREAFEEDEPNLKGEKIDFDNLHKLTKDFLKK